MLVSQHSPKLLLGLGAIFSGLILASIVGKQVSEELSPFFWRQSTCTIERSEVVFSPAENLGNAEKCRHILSYNYEVNGGLQRGNTWRIDPGEPFSWCSSWASFASNFAPNSTVECYIDPSDNTRSVLSRGNIFAVFKLLFPLLIVIVGVLILRKRAPSPAMPSSRVRLIATCVATGVFIAGTIGTFFAGVIPLYELYDSGDWKENNCEVLSSSLRSSSSGVAQGSNNSRGYQLDIVYTYSFDSANYVSDRFDFTKFGSGDDEALARITNKFPVGKIVPCWVDAANPYEAVLDRDLRLKYLAGFVPLLATFMGLLLLFVARRFI